MMSPEELAEIRANLRPNVPDTHPIAQLLAHIDAQAGQIEALKDALVEATALIIYCDEECTDDNTWWSQEDEDCKDEYRIKARKQLSEDPDMKAAGVTWEC